MGQSPAPTHDTPAGEPGEYRWTAEEGSARRMGWALLWSRTAFRVSLLGQGICLLMFALLFAFGGTGELEWWMPLIVISPLLMVWGAGRQFRTAAAPGTTLATEFGPHTFVVHTGAGSVEVAIGAVTAVRTVGDFVVLRLRGQQLPLVLPRAVFPDQEADRVRWEALGVRRG